MFKNLDVAVQIGSGDEFGRDGEGCNPVIEGFWRVKEHARLIRTSLSIHFVQRPSQLPILVHPIDREVRMSRPFSVLLTSLFNRLTNRIMTILSLSLVY